MKLFLWMAGMITLIACSVDHTGNGGFSETSDGTDTGKPDTDTDKKTCDTSIIATIRDFSKDHPDFGTYCCGATVGMVSTTLGEDQKPVFQPTYFDTTDTPMVTSKETFDQWYNTIENINFAFEREIRLKETAPGQFEYSNSAFFPLGEDEGFGDEGNGRNYYFTTEIHLNFDYKPGQLFSFTGDDDLFVFIEGKLVLDLGGVHEAEDAVIDLDTVAAMQGLTADETYAMDIFHAERHMSDSNFHIETTIDCFTPGVVVK